MASLMDMDFGCHCLPGPTAARLGDAPGPLLPAGGFLHRSLAPGGARPHHPRSRRPCPRRQPALPRARARPGPAAQAPRRGRGPATLGVRRAAAPGRRHRQLPPRGPCARQRADPHRAPGRGLGRLRRLQAGRRTRRARPSRSSAATPSSPRPPSGCPSTAGIDTRLVAEDILALVGRQPRGGPGLGAVLLRAGQGAAHARGAGPAHGPARARARRRRRDSWRSTARPACRCCPRSSCPRRRRAPPSRGRWCSRRRAPAAPRGCAASASTTTAFASGWMRVRGNRRRRGYRPRLRALGPRGLAGPAAHGGGDRAPPRARHPRLQRAARALPAREGRSTPRRSRTPFEGEAED